MPFYRGADDLFSSLEHGLTPPRANLIETDNKQIAGRTCLLVPANVSRYDPFQSRPRETALVCDAPAHD
jgi:hypothetical protein